MLQVHTNDGLTSRFDLGDEGQAREWLEKLKDPKFQASITGLTIHQDGVMYSLPRPRGFKDMFYQAELVQPDPARKLKGGERMQCMVDEVRVVVMVHREQRAARVAVTKMGKQRFNPLLVK